jgi:hypothetical protein
VLEDVFGLLRDFGLHVGHPGYYGLFNPAGAGKDSADYSAY